MVRTLSVFLCCLAQMHNILIFERVMTMIYVIILKCSELLKMNIYHKKPTFKIIFLFLSLIIDQFTLVLKLTHISFLEHKCCMLVG